MGILFKDGATNKQKLWTSLVYILLGMLFVGWFSDIIVDQRIAVYLFWFATVLSLVGLGFAFYALFKKESVFRARIRAQNKRLLTVMFGILIVVPLLSFGVVTKGLPASLHYLFAKQGSLIVVVAERNASYSDKFCNGGVTIDTRAPLMNDQVCGLQKDDWETLQAGEAIRLLGKKSIFGFTYDRYQILGSHAL